MAELARIEVIVFLQVVDVFSFCRAEEILRIAAIAQEKRFAAGEVIYRVNDSAGVLYCVYEGEVRQQAANGGGRSVGRHETLGIVEILSGRLRPHTAIAETDALLLTIDEEDFFDLLSNNIDIVKALFRHLAQELEAERSGRRF